jgi:O-antigen ligase
MLYELRINAALKKLLIFLSLINLFFLVLSQAKNSIIALLLIAAIAVFFDVALKRKLQKKIVKLLAVSTVLVMVVGVSLYFHNARYFFFLSESIKISMDYRLAHWSCALESIKSYYLLGTGTGMQDMVLNICYSTIGREDLLGYNTHNQYFELLLETGLIGFCLIIFWLGVLVYRALRFRYKSLLLWLVVFALAMATENVFSTQKAVLVLFSVLGLFLYPSINAAESAKD